ncbi:MAG: hypothetical protein RL341_2432 [Pseudomonadota bacterium]|jgi:hypothetical protein
MSQIIKKIQHAADAVSAICRAYVSFAKVHGVVEAFQAPRARFDVECRDAAGNLKWSTVAYNLVTTVGKNDLLDKYLSGSAYTAAWFCGLISSVGYTAIAAGDTMASHAGWTEAGGTNAPTYTGNRPALAFAAASGGSKATSSASSFTFTGAGTIKGMFGTSVTTKDGTAGILYNAVLFSGGDRVVANADVVNVNVTYTA